MRYIVAPGRGRRNGLAESWVGKKNGV